MNQRNLKLFEEYMLDEEARGHRAQGLKGLRNRVPHLFVYLEERGLRVEQVRVKEAQEFQGWLIERGRKDGGRYCMRTVLSFIFPALNFYDFAKRKGLVSANPFKEIKKVRPPKTLPRNILKEKPMFLVLESLARFDEVSGIKNKITRYRVHVISELMYSSGLRSCEVAGLMVSDIDFDKGLVMVRDGKGGSSRVGWLNDYALSVLRIYVNRMRPLVFNEFNVRHGDSLFGLSHERLARIVNDTLKLITAELGYESFRSHGFRHALGYHLLRAGCNIRYIQQILGHERLKDTEVYTRVENNDLKEVLDAFHPLG